jgi:dynein heavy chain
MELMQKMERLENGLLKLQSTASQVDDLKAKLASQEVELQQKNEDADKLIQKVGVETEKVSKEKAIADEEEKKVIALKAFGDTLSNTYRSIFRFHFPFNFLPEV